jgi:Zn-dependent protease with chaperone function/Zn finger protein HypA/HybF involved in hydrogenase expression
MAISRTINCKDCGHINTFKKKQLLDLKKSPKCERCQQELLRYFSRPMTGLLAESFIHPLDVQMLKALKKIPGIDSVLRSLLEHSFEMSMRLHHQANYVEISDKQLKNLYQKMLVAAQALDIDDLPELYLVQDAKAMAYTFGVKRCAIAISSGLIELLSDDEITSVIAHELGHIKAKHVLYKTASRILATIADTIANRTFGLGGLILHPIQIALLRWDRASELSADRASLLVVKNPMIVLNSLMKMAGGSSSIAHELNIDSFIKQAERFLETQREGILGKYIAVMNSLFSTHPFPIWRARELIDWVLTGDYLDLLADERPITPSDVHARCPTCKSIVSEKEDMCPVCQGHEETSNSGDKLKKTISDIRSWYNRNFNDGDN